MSAGAVFLLVALLALGGGIVLYLLIDAETERREPMSRDAAERAARRDEDKESRP